MTLSNLNSQDLLPHLCPGDGNVCQKLDEEYVREHVGSPHHSVWDIRGISRERPFTMDSALSLL